MPDFSNGRTLRERLLSRLVIDPSGCLLWTGRVEESGYAKISVKGRSCLVHRVMWELLEGPIAPGLELDHVKARGCRHRHCASIAHLEPVTPRENTLRGNTLQAMHAAKTHCVHGHPFDLLNTMWLREGWRVCRTCNRERQHRWKASAPDSIFMQVVASDA